MTDPVESAPPASLAPTRKVGAGALAGAVSVVVLWAIETFTTVDIPAEVAAAIATLIYFAVSYWVREP